MNDLLWTLNDAQANIASLREKDIRIIENFLSIEGSYYKQKIVMNLYNFMRKRNEYFNLSQSWAYVNHYFGDERFVYPEKNIPELYKMYSGSGWTGD